MMSTKSSILYSDCFTAKNKIGWLVFTDNGLRSLLFPKKNQQQPKGTIHKYHPLMQSITDYFNGSKVSFSAKIDWSDYTEFERSVFEECAQIKYGETVSYKKLAANIGCDKAYQAVGSALGRNRLPVIIPCHRVLRSNGSLGGFALGLSIKKTLLEMEKRNVS